MSPDVFAADGSWRAHYKFPAVALSSITNRVTGVALTGAMSAGGIIALVGGAEAVPMTMEMFKANAPLAVVPVLLLPPPPRPSVRPSPPPHSLDPFAAALPPRSPRVLQHYQSLCSG